MFLQSFARDEICFEARKLWKLPKISPVIMDQKQKGGIRKKIFPKNPQIITNKESKNIAPQHMPAAGNPCNIIIYKDKQRKYDNRWPWSRPNSANLENQSGHRRRKMSAGNNIRRDSTSATFDPNNNKTVLGYEADESDEDEEEGMICCNQDAQCTADENKIIIDKCLCRMPVVTSQPDAMRGHMDRPKYVISDSQERIQRIHSSTAWDSRNHDVIMSFPSSREHHKSLPEKNTSLPVGNLGSAMSIASTSLAYALCWKCFDSEESEESDYTSESGSDTEGEDTEKRASDGYNGIQMSDGSQVSDLEDSSGGSDNSNSDFDLDDSMSLYEEEIIVHESQGFGEPGMMSSDEEFGVEGGGNGFDSNSISESEEYFGDTDDYEAWYYKKDRQDSESVDVRSLYSNDF